MTLGNLRTNQILPLLQVDIEYRNEELAILFSLQKKTCKKRNFKWYWIHLQPAFHNTTPIANPMFKVTFRKRKRYILIKCNLADAFFSPIHFTQKIEKIYVFSMCIRLVQWSPLIRPQALPLCSIASASSVHSEAVANTCLLIIYNVFYALGYIRVDTSCVRSMDRSVLGFTVFSCVQNIVTNSHTHADKRRHVNTRILTYINSHASHITCWCCNSKRLISSSLFTFLYDWFAFLVSSFTYV